MQALGGERGGILHQGLIPHMGVAENQQSGISISPGSSHVNVGDMEPWMGGCFDSPILPSFSSHYVTGDGGVSGRRSTLRSQPLHVLKDCECIIILHQIPAMLIVITVGL